MGGAVRVVIKKEDSEVLSFVSWTNSIALILKSPEFLSGDLSGIVEHMEYYAKLQDDYVKNKASGKFDDFNTSVYGQYKFGEVFPVEYGIILVDFKDKKIYSHQDYTNLESHYGAFVRTKDGQCWLVPNSEKKVQELSAIVDRGMCSSVDFYLGDDWKTLEIPSGLSYFDIIRLINKEFDGKEVDYMDFGDSSLIHFNLKTKSDFTVLKYDSVKKLLNDIQSSGFVISENDLVKWEDFDNRYSRDNDE